MFSFLALLIYAMSIIITTGSAQQVTSAGTPATSLRTRHIVRQEDPNASNASKTWNQVDIFEDEGFLDSSQWEFFSGVDPSRGLVEYLSSHHAQSKGLAIVTDGQLVLSVDDSTQLTAGQRRNSVRISSKKTYNSGLFIADFAAMPVGCSVWPAWWTIGPNWPYGGEIDIVEGVNNQATNQYTVHTGYNCSSDPGANTTSQLLGSVCTSGPGADAGCGYEDKDPRSFGQGFNNAGGGVFVLLWDSKGITMWHFARAEIPQDITDGNPNPLIWPTPAATYPSSVCDFSKQFYDHVLIIDTTLCGDWAGPTYASSGCPGTCEEAVADPNNFVDAKWKINYIATYQ